MTDLLYDYPIDYGSANDCPTKFRCSEVGLLVATSSRCDVSVKAPLGAASVTKTDAVTGGTQHLPIPYESIVCGLKNVQNFTFEACSAQAILYMKVVFFGCG